MAIQRDRNSSSPRRGILSSFLILFDILVIAFSFYLWMNGQISKDIVAGVFIGVVILSLIMMSKSDKPRM